MLIDTHTHLYSEAFKDDIEEIISRAGSAGIERFYLPSIDSSYMESMFSLEQKYPGKMKLMMGLHPTSVTMETVEYELSLVKEQLDKRAFAAVGEIGIDLYWDKTYLKQQQDAFVRQIGWAKDKDLPIVIHCRESFDEIFEILEQEKDEKLYGIFHCFTGTIDQAHQAISYGMKLGIGGVVTFKNGKIDQFINEIPLDNIVLETDSPYLAPAPYRGKRNESSYLKLVADKLSLLYNLPVSEIAGITSRNALEIFKEY